MEIVPLPEHLRWGLNAMDNYFNRKDIIYTVYQEGSISKAAQKLFISQPSLSVMIHKVEEEIGTPLFDRTSKPIRLTETGQEYIKAAEEILHIEKSFQNYLDAVEELQSGSLNLGSNQLLSSLVLPKYIARFISKYPNIQLHLADDNSTVLENMISSGQLDFIIDNQRLDSEIFEQQKLKEEQLLLAVPDTFACNKELGNYSLREMDVISGDHLDKACKPVALEKFRDVPFVTMTRENETRHRSDEMFREAGFKPKTILEIDRLVTLYNFVEMGAAAAIVSDTLVQNIQHHSGKVCFYRLDSQFAKREIYLTWKRNKYYSKAMKAFVAILADGI